MAGPLKNTFFCGFPILNRNECLEGEFGNCLDYFSMYNVKCNGNETDISDCEVKTPISICFSIKAVDRDQVFKNCDPDPIVLTNLILTR